MAQNIYDDPVFFAGYSGLPRSVRGLDGAPEWPSVRALIPDLEGRRVVDLGCGFGWFARWARGQGAAHVLGLDLSANMLARARDGTHDAGVEYQSADLDHLELPAGSFDFAYSALALHYVADFARLMASVHRALVPGAHFVFTVEHPIFTAPPHPGWSQGPDGLKTWPVSQYGVEGPRTRDWLGRPVAKQHRTFGTTLNALIAAGFTIRHVEDWAPTAAQIAADPDLAEELDRPTFMLVAARRAG